MSVDQMPKPTETTSDQLTALEEFDLSPVTARLKHKGFEDAEHLEQEFRRMVRIQLIEPEEPIAPSSPVDEFWHEFILNTKLYREFCDRVIGDFWHHVPDVPEIEVNEEGDSTEPKQTVDRETDSADGDEMIDAYRRTLSLYEKHFGTPSKHYWPRPDTVDQNSSDTDATCRSDTDATCRSE